MSVPTRRHLMKGAAWAAPTAAVSLAAPAFAAYGAENARLDVNGRVTWNLDADSNTIDYYEGFKAFSTSPGSVRRGAGYCVSGIARGTVLSDMTVTYWLPVNPRVGFRDGVQQGWSALVRNSDLPTKWVDGVTLYAFAASYSRRITSGGDSYCYPAFGYVSDDGAALQGDSFYVSNSVKVDGKTITFDAGPVRIVTRG